MSTHSTPGAQTYPWWLRGDRVNEWLSLWFTSFVHGHRNRQLIILISLASREWAVENADNGDHGME